MKNLIKLTAIALTLTATTAVAHQADTTTDSSFKRGYCLQLIYAVEDDIVSVEESLEIFSIEDYLGVEYTREYLAGSNEAGGKIAFGNPTREDIVTCIDYIKGLGKAKWDLHNK